MAGRSTSGQGVTPRQHKYAVAALSHWGRIHQADRAAQGPRLSIPQTSKEYVAPIDTDTVYVEQPDADWFDRINEAIHNLKPPTQIILKSVYIHGGRVRRRGTLEKCVRLFWMMYK